MRRLIAILGLGLSVGCNSPQLRAFFPATASFERTFGQLYDASGTPKVSHYAVLHLGSGSARAMATGTIEYRRAFDEMGNCLLLRPKKHFSTPNNFSKLKKLPKPGALVVGYCNLDEPSVQAQVQALFVSKLSAAEAPGATTQFLNNEESFRRLEVSADAADITLSTELGSALAGRLYVAAFTERDDGTRTYVNPLAYLAGALPAASLDAVAPTVDEIVFETSDDGTFGAGHPTYAASGGALSTPVPRHPLRVAVRVTDRSVGAGAVTVPYELGYELASLTLSGPTVVASEVKSRGVALMNSLTLSEAAARAAALYGAAAPTASNVATGIHYLHVAWNPASPPLALNAEELPSNLLASSTSVVMDLGRSVDGAPVFPVGDYSLRVWVRDVVNPAVPTSEQTVRFAIATGPAAPGDSEITYQPVAGPLGTELVVTTAVSGAFVAGATRVEFTGTFDPDGPDLAGTELPPTPSFTIAYAPAQVRVIDGEHLAIRIGAVKPPLTIMTSSQLRHGFTGRLAGSLRVQTGAPPTYDHLTPNVFFTVQESAQFGLLVGDALQIPAALPLNFATSATQVAAAPDFQRVVAEWRVQPVSAPPPASVDVRVRTVAASGAELDDQTHRLGLAGEEGGLAVYRSGVGGGRKLVFVTGAGLSGPQGSGVLAVRAEPGGTVRLDGEPPP